MERDRPPNYEFQLIEPLKGLVASCEINCVAGCCGTDAFDVAASHIAGWMREQEVSHIWTALDQLSAHRNEVLAQNDSSPTSDDFNAWWATPTECDAYLKIWAQEA